MAAQAAGMIGGAGSSGAAGSAAGGAAGGAGGAGYGQIFAGAGAGGILGMANTGLQYALNKKLAEKQMKWAGDQAIFQRMWEEQMYGSRYQRTMEDLRLAGLNPILAVGGLSGNIPTSGIPSAGLASVSRGDLAGDIAKGISTAKQIKAVNDELRILREQANRAPYETHQEEWKANILQHERDIAYEDKKTAQERRKQSQLETKGMKADLEERKRRGELYGGKWGDFWMFAREAADILGKVIGLRGGIGFHSGKSVSESTSRSFNRSIITNTGRR